MRSSRARLGRRSSHSTPRAATSSASSKTSTRRQPIPYPNLRTLRPDELAFLKRWIEAGARDDDGAVPYADAEHVLFACVQGENLVALIDAARRRVIRRVYLDDHGIPSAPYGPHHIVFEPDASAWYVSLISAGAVAKLSMDLSMDPSDPAYLLAASPTGGFTTPGMMALDGDAGRLYVGRSTLSSGGTYGLGVFDARTMDFAEEIPLPAFDIPHALALTSDGRYLLTAPLSGRDALVVDAASGDLVAQTPLGSANRELVHFSLLPDGRTATLTSNSEGTSEVLFFTLGDDGALTLDGSVPTGARAWHGHLDSDGRTLLVPNRAGNSVTLIDVPDGRGPADGRKRERGRSDRDAALARADLRGRVLRIKLEPARHVGAAVPLARRARRRRRPHAAPERRLRQRHRARRDDGRGAGCDPARPLPLRRRAPDAPRHEPWRDGPRRHGP